MVILLALLQCIMEIDENYIAKQKKSSAPCRKLNGSFELMLGLIERDTKRFVIIIVTDRTETTIIPIILKHVKIASKIFSDSYSV
jgi:ISXO2-like transposase domain